MTINTTNHSISTLCFPCIGRTPKTDEQIKAEQHIKANKTLRKAAGRGDLEKIKMLLKQGADIPTTDGSRSGEAPLHKAGKYNQSGAIELMLKTLDSTPALKKQKKAIVNAPNKQGQTPLHKAISNRRTEALDALLQEPLSDVNAQDQSGDSIVTAGLKSTNPLGAARVISDPRFDTSPANLKKAWNQLIKSAPTLTYIQRASMAHTDLIQQFMQKNIAVVAEPLAQKSDTETLKNLNQQLQHSHLSPATKNTLLTILNTELSDRI